MQTRKIEKMEVLRDKWTVAELRVSFRPEERTGTFITNSFDAWRVFRRMWDKDLVTIQEQFCALYLNASSEVIGFRLITTGKLSQNTIDTQLLLSCALVCRAAGIIIAHNHPGGSLKPSQADRILTRHLESLCTMFEFKILDHLILTEYDYISFVDRGWISKEINA